MKGTRLTRKFCLENAVLLCWTHHTLFTRVAWSSRCTTASIAHSIVCLCSSNNVKWSLLIAAIHLCLACSKFASSSTKSVWTKPTSLQHHLEDDYYFSVATYPCECNQELIQIKCAPNPDFQSGLTHPCERGTRGACLWNYRLRRFRGRSGAYTPSWLQVRQ